MPAIFNWYSLFAIIATYLFYSHRKKTRPDHQDEDATNHWLKCEDPLSVILILAIIALVTASICRIVSST